MIVAALAAIAVAVPMAAGPATSDRSDAGTMSRHEWSDVRPGWTPRHVGLHCQCQPLAIQAHNGARTYYYLGAALGTSSRVTYRMRGDLLRARHKAWCTGFVVGAMSNVTCGRPW